MDEETRIYPRDEVERETAERAGGLQLGRRL